MGFFLEIAKWSALSASGAGVIVLILTRVVDKEKLVAYAYHWGIKHSAIMNSKLGKAFWEKIEEFLQDRLLAVVQSYLAGLDADDTK